MISLLLASFIYICNYSSLFSILKYIYLEYLRSKVSKYLCIIITEIRFYIIFSKAKVSNLL